MAFAYDLHIYPSALFPQTHPSRMAAIGTLSGLTPPPIDNCRVLEIACYDGSNLLPMAAALPASEFVGVDLASSAIERGTDLVRRSGLTNVSLQCMDLMDFPADAGTFDYISAHGFYSWVPDFVRARMWEVIDRHLSPNGIAYVSYNASPAGHLRNATREMMLFHLGRARPPLAEMSLVANGFLADMAEIAGGEAVWKSWLEFESGRIAHRDLDVLHHDELAGVFRPFSLTEVCADAAKGGLQYLGESRLRHFFRSPNPDLEKFGPQTFVESEQYRDYVEFRSFRESLFCRAGLELSRPQWEERVEDVWAASSVQWDGDAFCEPHGPLRISTDHPEILSLLNKLVDLWPSAGRIEPHEMAAADPLLKAGVIDLRAHPLVAPGGPGPRPKASPLVRAQLAVNTETSTLVHNIARIPDDEDRQMICSLDGSRTVEQLPSGLAARLSDFYKMGLLLGASA
ncbi:MAG: methyltransferase domain-containing protein [Acidobacteria bacterium]|nr:methyltransferase domain-containing protein [Acidobacteriota bacterium]